MNIDNNSLYVQDHWTINSRWSADLGARYEHVKVVSTPGDILEHRQQPHRAAARGRVGRAAATATRSSTSPTGSIPAGTTKRRLARTAPSGIPPDINFIYTGPAGQGRGFAPGFNLANYPLNTAFVFSAPLANTFMAPGLKSPLTHEFTASYRRRTSGTARDTARSPTSIA